MPFVFYLLGKFNLENKNYSFFEERIKMIVSKPDEKRKASISFRKGWEFVYFCFLCCK